MQATGTRKVLAGNLLGRMAERFPYAPDRVRALSDASGVARSTIQRLLEVDVAGASIDTVTQLANALHCEAYELLIPDRFLRPKGATTSREPPPARLPSKTP